LTKDCLEFKANLHEREIVVEKLKYKLVDLEGKYSETQNDALIGEKTLKDEMKRSDLDKKMLLNNVSELVKIFFNFGIVGRKGSTV
jgi:hypothetical protein